MNTPEQQKPEAHTSTWSVWRQDDHGNTFLVSPGHTEAEALQKVEYFKAKGHKQMYWAKQACAHRDLKD
ncbi:MAG: hypothetical protein AAF512_10490 [Pseudomonadota bacterium]